MAVLFYIARIKVPMSAYSFAIQLFGIAFQGLRVNVLNISHSFCWCFFFLFLMAVMESYILCWLRVFILYTNRAFTCMHIKGRRADMGTLAILGRRITVLAKTETGDHFHFFQKFLGRVDT